MQPCPSAPHASLCGAVGRENHGKQEPIGENAWINNADWGNFSMRQLKTDNATRCIAKQAANPRPHQRRSRKSVLVQGLGKRVASDEATNVTMNNGNDARPVHRAASCQPSSSDDPLAIPSDRAIDPTANPTHIGQRFGISHGSEMGVMGANCPATIITESSHE